MRVPVLGAYPVSSGSYKNIILPIARRNALPHLNIPIDEKVTAGSTMEDGELMSEIQRLLHVCTI